MTERCLDDRGFHDWPDDEEWCPRCGTSWLSFAANLRVQGTRVTRDEQSIRFEFTDPIQASWRTACAWVQFAESTLDDPPALASMVEQAKTHALRNYSGDPDVVTWEEPMVGRIAAREDEHLPTVRGCVFVVGQ